jgi:hypothetical protein
MKKKLKQLSYRHFFLTYSERYFNKTEAHCKLSNTDRPKLFFVIYVRLELH